MTNWTRDDIDIAFIREFSANGVVLSGPMSTDTRRERIRIEIWRHNRSDLPFHDSGMTYAEAYFTRYSRSLEMRSTPRDFLGRPPQSTGLENDIDSEDDNADLT